MILTTLQYEMVNMLCWLLFVTGGLTAVIWTDFIQTVIMLIGAVYLMTVSEFIALANQPL